MKSIYAHLKNNGLQLKDFEIIFLDQCPSTNDFAKSKQIEQPTVVITNHQTMGRGQNSHQWIDSKDQCLLITMAWPKIKVVPPPETTLEFGKLAAQSLNKVWPQLKIHIKTPNDIYLEESSSGLKKKAGGILMESVGHSNEWTLIFGFGLNILGEPFDPSTSVSKALKDPISPYEATRFVTDLIESCHNFVAPKRH